MEELEILVKSVREKEWRVMKFQAGLKGVDLEADEDKDEALEAVKERAQARINEIAKERGVTDHDREAAEFAAIGIRVKQE